MAELIVLLPLAAAAFVARVRGDAKTRPMAICAAAASLLLSLAILVAPLAEPWAASLFRIDRASGVPMALFAALALVTLVVAPRRDSDRRFLVRVLILLSSTVAAYAAANPIVFLVAWIVAGLSSGISRPARIAGALSLGAAVVLIEVGGSRPAALALVIVAAILQTGLFPAHRLAMGAFESPRILLAGLSMNSQLGAFLVARNAYSMFPEVAAGAMPWLSGLALFTSVYTALLGIAERDPRRLLSVIMVSQCAAILAGLASGSQEGHTGALVQWIVVALASTALISIYRSVEARIGGNPGTLRFLGLAAQMPRLAVFFAISALALIGLPGTLGFAGQHLLVHGMFAAHSWWGVALPIAIALNAYHVFMLFTHLFLGKPVFNRATVSDALPRERWALAAFVVLLILGGLAPGRVVALRGIAQDAASPGNGGPASPH